MAPGSAANLGINKSDFDGINMDEEFTKRLGVKTVVRNDALAQMGFGLQALLDSEDTRKILTGKKVAYIGPGTGLGGAFGQIDNDGNVEYYTDGHIYDLKIEDGMELVINIEGSETVTIPLTGMAEDVFSGRAIQEMQEVINIRETDHGLQPIFKGELGGKLLNNILEQKNDEHLEYKIAMQIAEFEGEMLGQIVEKVYTGDIKKWNDSADWSDKDRELVKGTVNFVLAGSVATKGEVGRIIKETAETYLKEKYENIGFNLIPLNVESSEAGVLGAVSFVEKFVNAHNAQPTSSPVIAAVAKWLESSRFDERSVRADLKNKGYEKGQIDESVEFYKEHRRLQKKFKNLTPQAILDMQEYQRVKKTLGDQLYYYTDGIKFTSLAWKNKTMYMPLSGGEEGTMMSAITSQLSGDANTHADRYELKPASAEDLRNVVRNFWVSVNEKAYSFTNEGEGSYGYVERGPLWQRLTVVHPEVGIKMEATSFVPKGMKAEVMDVKVTNISSAKQKIRPTAAIPIYARSKRNVDDHEHVTALIQIIEQTENGVKVKPPMLFNEAGHTPIETTFYVNGYSDDGKMLEGTFPTRESFLGKESGLENPLAVAENLEPQELEPEKLKGVEAMGGLRFADKTLMPGQEAGYVVVMGIGDTEAEADAEFERLNQTEKVAQAFEDIQNFWTDKSESIKWKTGDEQFNKWMSWVNIQPTLRKIFGCSFLPHHDYGFGGRGWRDLFQDMLAIILDSPEDVRESLVTYFGGVRMDGTNATMITSAAEDWFKGDRNGLSRVWMDHGTWPWFTLMRYINETGDYGILSQTNGYFKDAQMSRAADKHRVDRDWTENDGFVQKDKHGNIYQGTLIEHVLIQSLVQFFNVGEHNNIRHEGTGWNDAFDEAPEKGENVAFSAFYAGNMLSLADMLEQKAKKDGTTKIEIAKEVLILLDRISEETGYVDYENVEAKQKKRDKYFEAVQPVLSGEQVEVDIADVIRDLRTKGRWIFQHIQNNEIITVKDGEESFSIVRGYYDNQGQSLEGQKENGVWMTLTGQVFPLMMGAMTKAQAKEIIKSVNHFLKDPKLGGYRLNNDFGKGDQKILDYLRKNMGRAFAFAFGTKENGAMFSHMIVMYAYALYQQGFAHEGYAVIESIYQLHQDTAQSGVFPQMSEYLDSNGEGFYSYLTGSASWIVYTMLTKAFGVEGNGGDLMLKPQLIRK
ncbi:MAG: hypothetical protein KAS92_00415, partial [Candidatus Omnitrophica bacterium]|nr:hypothetical protein [Candidatus Omnitrophota bacterium]